MAIAKMRNLPLVIEEGRARRKAENHKIETLNWRELFEG